jgi:non-ribosomal peptide synthase protein (TIGR01720 family)
VLVQSEQGVLTGEVSLLPIQQWFLEKVETEKLSQPNHWNQSFLVRVPELDINKLFAVIEKLVAYHDVLRMQYNKEEGNEGSTGKGVIHWKQVYQPGVAIPELRILNSSEYSEAEVQQLLTDWQSGFDLEQGPLFQLGYLYGYEDGSARIYFALHHLIIDGVSWRILTEDIKALYEGKSLPAKGSSYRQWSEQMKHYAREHLSEGNYWQEQLNALPDYHTKEKEQEASAASFELDKELTKSLLQQVSKAYHTEINDLLLTAFAYALKEMNQQDIQGITLEGHGREEIDVTIDHSRTVGWFTTLFPVKLQLQTTVEESIKFIKESLRSIPNKGIGFGSFAASKVTGYTFKDLAPISFNYLGQFDIQHGYWQIASEEVSGTSIHPANTDHHLININGMISNGKLGFSVITKLGEAMTNQVCESFKIHLVKIIQHCQEKLEGEGTSYTPSDFNSVSISQTLLDELQLLSD